MGNVAARSRYIMQQENKKMSKKEKQQVLLRGDGWKVTRSNDKYGYRLEGDLCKLNGIVFDGSLPLAQEDVARLFAEQGLVWRYE